MFNVSILVLISVRNFNKIMKQQNKGGTKMTEKVKLPHKCPNCGKEAKTMAELEKLFGFRTMNETTGRSQSWCKECR